MRTRLRLGLVQLSQRAKARGGGGREEVRVEAGDGGGDTGGEGVEGEAAGGAGGLAGHGLGKVDGVEQLMKVVADGDVGA